MKLSLIFYQVENVITLNLATKVFLNSVIYPLTKVSSLVHDEFFNHDSHRTHIKRKRDIDDYAFIGESIDENDKPRGDQRTSIRNFF